LTLAAGARGTGLAGAPAADAARLERDLARWKEHEMMPLLPGIAPNDEPTPAPGGTE
ncbi:MAG: hypothetical protein JWM27_4313, partial [Gemmatimonadetes bacterium]|nr:hypothetical protein [Gemmatimonadota bacterium]